MNEITVAELIALLQSESASIDMQFQLWITITTAVVIAGYSVRNLLSSMMRIFIAVMYALAAATIAFRYANDASQFIFLKNELSSRGVDYPTVIDLRILRALIFSCGTIATLVFISFKSTSKEITPPSNEPHKQPGDE